MHREGINLDFTMYVGPSKLTLIMHRYHHEGITQPRIINEINVKHMKSNFTPVMWCISECNRIQQEKNVGGSWF